MTASHLVAKRRYRVVWARVPGENPVLLDTGPRRSSRHEPAVAGLVRQAIGCFWGNGNEE